VMFINGRAVAVNASVNLLPSDVAGDANYLGRSQFAGDPDYDGRMDAVQISALTLPVETLTAASLEFTPAGGALTLSWPAWMNGLALYASAGLGGNAVWTPVTNTPVVTNGINFLTLAPTNRQEFFRLQTP